MCDLFLLVVWFLSCSSRVSPRVHHVPRRDPLLSWKIGHLGFHPTSSWYLEPHWSWFRSLPSLFSSLILLVSSYIQKFPPKNSPNFFLWFVGFDDVLLDFIHGFAWFQVDLAFPHLFPSIHPQNLPNFAQEISIFRHEIVKFWHIVDQKWRRISGKHIGLFGKCFSMESLD